MSLEVKINEDIKKAMLLKAKDRLEALRAIKSAILLAKTGKGSEGIVNDDDAVKILQKLVKQRRETAEIYLSQNRKDLADVEIFQADVIQEYLPAQLGVDELETIIKHIISETGAISIKDMGKVMSAASAKLSGRADNKTIADLVKKNLTP